MKIQRIDNYSDNRFSQIVLNQHGAYLIDNIYPCEFTITSYNSANINFHDYTNVDILKQIAEEFRFYSANITKFYDTRNNLLFEYQDVNIYKMPIDTLQPSQFYVNSEKLEQIKSWAKKQEDFIIPIMKNEDEKIILDGHTRLYLAKMLGYNEVYIFEDSTDEYIFWFVSEAKNRGIFKIDDLTVVSDIDYKNLWYKFCDDYFAKAKESEIK